MSSIHPTAILGPGVEVGEDVTIGPYATITGPCQVGDGVWIGPHASLGTPAEIRGGPHPSFEAGGGAGVVVGARTVLREFVTVNQGSVSPTGIGEDCYLMDGAHLSHDVAIGRSCTIAHSALIAGHCWIGEGANVGMGAALHQFSVVGAYAMIGMQATVTRPVPPFSLAYGVPARVAGVNRVGLLRLGVAEEVVDGWQGVLVAGEVAGADGPPHLASHVVAYEGRLNRSDG